MSWNGPFIVLLAVVLLVGTGTGFGLADPPSNSTESNGLTDAELATLFSRDSDSVNSTPLTRARDETKAIQELANGTDITFTRMPAIASTWTRNDFRDLAAGDVQISRHPPYADPVSERFLKAVHVSVFSITPSSRIHFAPGKVPLFLTSDGYLRAFIDYRVAAPANDTAGAHRVYWSVTHHGIKRVRLMSGDAVLDSNDSTHTPRLGFTGLDAGNRTLTVEAVVNATLRKKTRDKHFRDDDEECERDEDNANDGEDDDDDGEVDEGGECSYWTSSTSTLSEELTVNASRSVTVYRLHPSVRYAQFPDGSVEVLVTADQPWTGVTIGQTNITGIWRSYTARDPRWDTLLASSESETRQLVSDALPVAVHAYPSQTGTLIRPVRGPELLDVMGPEMASPAATLGANISVDVVTQRYRRSHAILIRLPDFVFDREAVRVWGIVRGVSATPDESAVTGEVVRRSNLTIEVLETNESVATLRLRLQDNRTGRPIVLREDQRPRDEPARDGYITVAGRRVETNRSGVALVTVDQPGVYTARYHPGSWLQVDPAFTSDTATARWHPLTTLDGWVSLLVQVVWLSIPFAVVYYAGTRLLVLLGRQNTP